MEESGNRKPGAAQPGAVSREPEESKREQEGIMSPATADLSQEEKENIFVFFGECGGDRQHFPSLSLT